MMRTATLLFASLLAGFALSSCSSGIDFPNGSSKGYQSARLVRKNPTAETTSKEESIHRMIQNSLRAQFAAQGLQYGTPNSDLIVSYLVVYQDNAMTTFFDSYFGSSGDAQEISSAAHKKGVIEGKRPDSYERAGLVVNIFDAKTNELIHRDYASGDIVRGVSDATRQQRVNQAVATALRNFFD